MSLLDFLGSLFHKRSTIACCGVVTNKSYTELSQWFNEQTDYSFLVLFLNSNNPKDKNIYRGIRNNYFLLDRLSGSKICFIYFERYGIETETNMSPATQKLIKWIREKTPDLSEDKFDGFYGNLFKMTDDICRTHLISSWDLPGLLIESKKNQTNDSTQRPILIPLSFYEDVESIFYMFSIFDSYIKDISGVKCKVNNEDLRSIDTKNNNTQIKKIAEVYSARLASVLLVSQEWCSNLLDGLDNDNFAQRIYVALNEIRTRNIKINFELEKVKNDIRDRRYDIFISTKSEDYQRAMVVYDYLKRKGRHPFLAEPSLRELGKDEYGKVIREVIGICEDMVVFTTNPSYVNTSYVSYEWNLYLDEKSSGRKRGNIVTIVSEDVIVGDLPIGLKNCQSFFENDFTKSLLKYLRSYKKNNSRS